VLQKWRGSCRLNREGGTTAHAAVENGLNQPTALHCRGKAKPPGIAS
jgi:hypothetical protein